MDTRLFYRSPAPPSGVVRDSLGGTSTDHPRQLFGLRACISFRTGDLENDGALAVLPRWRSHH